MPTSQVLTPLFFSSSLYTCERLPAGPVAVSLLYMTGVYWANTDHLLVDGGLSEQDVWLQGHRRKYCPADSDERRESATRWQTLSAPAAGIMSGCRANRYRLGGGGAGARHPHHRLCRDIFQSNQRAVKSVLCELRGALTGSLSGLQ